MYSSQTRPQSDSSGWGPGVDCGSSSIGFKAQKSLCNIRSTEEHYELSCPRASRDNRLPDWEFSILQPVRTRVDPWRRTGRRMGGEGSQTSRGKIKHRRLGSPNMLESR